ncbi:MAG: hypothetical protein WCC30_01750 [Candidatus Dormiibacterota bacterium]
MAFQLWRAHCTLGCASLVRQPIDALVYHGAGWQAPTRERMITALNGGLTPS